MNYNQDYEYANSRLSGSFIFHNGYFSFIEGISGSGKVSLNYSDGINLYNLTEQLENICIDSPSLGYFNMPMESIYLSRLPTRRYKQGLTTHNLKLVSRQYKLNPTLIYNLNLGNKYSLDLDYVIDSLYNEERTSYAISPNFLLTKDKDNIFLNYKGKSSNFGEFNIKDKKIKLYDECLFLKEQLEEDLKEVIE